MPDLQDALATINESLAEAVSQAGATNLDTVERTYRDGIVSGIMRVRRAVSALNES